MKRTLVFFLLPSCFLVACNSEEQVSTPEDIGPQVMKILEELNDITEREFQENFITSKQLQKIANNEQRINDEGQRRSMTSVTKEQMEVRYNFMFQRLKDAGKGFGINWENIKFVSFKHKKEIYRGAEFCSGELKFKHQSRSFTVETYSFYDGSRYILTSLEKLKEI
ncbi:MAG: hypothetical protein ACFHU9_06090 [Fluviicola sp.]